jgi:hypothetical protein
MLMKGLKSNSSHCLFSIPHSCEEATLLVGRRYRSPQPQLKGWRVYFYEISWPSVVFSAVLVCFAHFVDLPEYDNW